MTGAPQICIITDVLECRHRHPLAKTLHLIPVDFDRRVEQSEYMYCVHIQNIRTVCSCCLLSLHVFAICPDLDLSPTVLILSTIELAMAKILYQHLPVDGHPSIFL